MFTTHSCLPTEVDLSYPLYQSQLGRYFIGQTPPLSGQNAHAIAALANPPCSDVTLYPNAITVTNTSTSSLFAEIYLKASIDNPLVSTSVSCVNLGITPEPIPTGQIQYLPTVSVPPTHGVVLFSRIVPPLSTLVIDGGQIILPPAQSLIVYIGGSLPVTFNETIIALGWWEEPILSPCYCE